MTRVLLVVGLAAALVGAGFLVAGREEPDLPATLAVITVAVLAVAVALSWDAARGRGTVVVALLAVLAAAGTALTAVLTGWPGPGPAVLLGGALLVLVAPALRRLRQATAVVVGTVLLLAAAGAVAAAGPVVGTLPVSSTEARAPVPVAGARWHLDLGEVRGAVVAGPGLVLAASPSEERATDVALGVDTATGRVAWSHRRAGTAVDEVVATPDGRAVAVLARFSDGGRPDDDRVLTVLDAATGRVLWSDLVHGTTLRASDRVVAVATPEGRLEARARDTGAHAWWADPAPRCAFVPTRAVGTVGVMPVVQDCPGPLGGPPAFRATIGLADASGAGVWTTPPEALSGREDQIAALPVTAGGRFVAAEGGVSVLDVRDGRAVASIRPGERLDDDGAGIVVTASLAPAGIVDPATGAVLPVPPCPEPRLAAPAVVDGAPVALCELGDGAGELRGAPPGRLPPGTVPSVRSVLDTGPGGLVVVPNPFRAGPVVGL
ncbi:PQQ-binding-like beta-propeller repeat protein [Actinomycetospora sp. OC33-EN08]|uniref:PQQ-binding-like beta-propeller repeat protein n=1 Tax=Actinomycetospora aurantiaca TaxID=3129233 RepID=A0ABU8MWR0_9PSEU